VLETLAHSVQAVAATDADQAGGIWRWLCEPVLDRE